MIPGFEQLITGQKYRFLPCGIIKASWIEFYNRFNTSQRRIMLLNGLLIMLQELRIANCQSVKIDGSFVTSKPRPSDFDGT